MFFPLRVVAVVAFTAAALAAPKANPDWCNEDTAPFQIRLAYAGDSGMAVSWNTKQKLANPTVYFSRNGILNRFARSDISATYPTSSTYNNHVVITGLKSDTTYYYMPECGNQTYTFKTARRAGSSTEFSFAMVGDMGTFGPDGLSTTVGKGASNPLKPGEKTTIESLMTLKDSYDFVWHVGDIAYADAWLKEEKAGYISPVNKTDGGAEYDKILNEFYGQVAQISSIRPYMVGPGNHEANCDNGSELDICLPGQLNFTGYRAHWNMPSAESGGVENFWYSWDHGSVHFIQFNTETDFPNAPDEPGGEGGEDAGPFAPSGSQLAWLKKDLASVDRKKTPWVIASGHRPWYVSTTECLECQAAFEPFLLQYGVDLVLHGHKHFYERHAAVDNGTAQEIDANPTAPWYIVNGAAGHYDGLDTPSLPYVPTSRKVISVYGWSLFTVHNCTHLSTQFIASGNSSILDTATLIKDRTCYRQGDFK
ncbi:Metallo-dependent phosphatase-like protein [Lipomyces doorenjongii]|uniref:Metallo-dependent phosphatase-like protein n=1 Tax=Lipomyces doorenjongii TaxID=383834 RepID=UPI0034D01F3A